MTASNDCDRETSPFRKLALGAAAFGLSLMTKVFPENRHGDFSPRTTSAPRRFSLDANQEVVDSWIKESSWERKKRERGGREGGGREKQLARFTHLLPGSEPLLYFIHARRGRSIKASFDHSSDRVTGDRSFLLFFFFLFFPFFLFFFFFFFFRGKPRNHSSDYSARTLIPILGGSPCSTKATKGVIAKYTHCRAQIVYHLHENR